MTQPDLFTYPQSPGYRRTDTSKAAAEKMKPHAPTLRDMTLGALKDFGSMTADEIAAHLSKSILSVRPRVAELHAMGLVEDTGRRKLNTSQSSAIVWQAKTAA